MTQEQIEDAIGIYEQGKQRLEKLREQYRQHNRAKPRKGTKKYTEWAAQEDALQAGFQAEQKVVEEDQNDRSSPRCGVISSDGRSVQETVDGATGRQYGKSALSDKEIYERAVAVRS